MTQIEIKNKLKELKYKAEYLQSCIDDLEIEIDNYEYELASLKGKKERKEDELEDIEEEVDNAQDELNSYERKKERKVCELDDIEEEIEKLEREEPEETEFYNETYEENPNQLKLFK